MYYLIIPAFEPDQKLIKLLEDAKQHLNCQIIVVNDGSSLHTKPIFEKASEFAIVLDHPKNMGKGQSLRTAFRYVQSLDRDAVIVTADADGQHSVRDIDRVAHAATHLPNRLILGVREFTKDVPLRSRLGPPSLQNPNGSGRDRYTDRTSSLPNPDDSLYARNRRRSIRV